MLFFSIIVPIYNVEKYLKECLDSLINQSFKNIEIILVNDGSTDNSGKIAREYAKNDKRIKFIEQKNQGLSMARNNALAVANGEYIVFVDSDDYIALNMCEKLFNILKDNPVDIIKYKTINNSNTQTPYPIPNNNPTTGKNYILFYPNCLGSGCVWLFTIRRHLLLQNNITFIPKILYEDMGFIAEILLVANTLLITDFSFYYYRIREDSIMHTKPTQQKNLHSIQSYLAIANSFYNMAKPQEGAIKQILLNQIAIYYQLSINKAGSNLQLIKQIKQNFEPLKQHLPKTNYLTLLLYPIKHFIKSQAQKLPQPLKNFLKTKILRRKPQ